MNKRSEQELGKCPTCKRDIELKVYKKKEYRFGVSIQGDDLVETEEEALEGWEELGEYECAYTCGFTCSWGVAMSLLKGIPLREWEMPFND